MIQIPSYYNIRKEDFHKYSPFKFKIVNSIDDLYYEFAIDLIKLIKRNNEEERETTVILPVGPFDYTVVAEQLNRENVYCGNLRIFMMDEYCTDEGDIIPYDHPLSFHRFIHENFFSRLKNSIRMPKENIIFPDPKRPDITTRIIIEELGGVDVCYGGVGINGHFAFNEPPEDGQDVRNSVTRVVTLSRETRTALALGSTDGDWSIIPRKAITLGMRELLLSKEIHLYFMRSWHSGIMRRTLFGPVSPDFPASYIQTHPKVMVTLTEYVAQVPSINVRQALVLK